MVMPSVLSSGLDANSFKLILEFMYLNKIKVTESNVTHLLPAASLLQIMPIVEACAEFLKDKLQPSNCLGLLLVISILSEIMEFEKFTVIYFTFEDHFI